MSLLTHTLAGTTSAALLLLAIAPGAIHAAPQQPSSSRPSIVFIYADDLGFGDLACHGHPQIKTPHLDRLAREGIDFWSFNVVNPVCSPSRTGIVTGQYPSRWGVHQHFASHELNAQRNMPDWLDPRAPLLPRVLKSAGYRTAHYGKWHLSGGGIQDAPLPAAYGYDDAAVWTGPGRSVFDGSRFTVERGEGAAQDRQASSLLSVAATDHAVEFIRASKGAPFYVNLWLHETHHLVSATEEDKKPYPGVPEPHRTYYAAVSRADRQVGRILAVLDERDLARNTIVVFSSDNGPENSHSRPDQKFYYSQGSTGGLRGRKRSLLMGGVNVPFLVRWPGVVPAGRVDKTTALAAVDMFPTLLAVAGVPTPAGYVGDGENMLATFQGRPRPRTKPIFWWWQGGHGGDDWPAFAMREGSWVLTLDQTKKRVELHDVVADRFQAHNRAADQPERVARMTAAIDAWFATLQKQVDPALQTKGAARPAAGASPETRARAFERWDKDRNGFLSLTEYRAGLVDKANAESRFRNFDRNGDGKLTREEFVGQPTP